MMYRSTNAQHCMVNVEMSIGRKVRLIFADWNFSNMRLSR